MSPVVYNCIIRQIFSAKFIEVFTETRSGEDRINFYSAALLFAELRHKKLKLPDNRVMNFVTKNKKRNVGF